MTPVLHPTVAPPVMPMVLPPVVTPLPGIPALGVGPVPASTVPVFRGVPLAPVPAGMATGVSLFQTSLAPPPGFKLLPASIHVTSTSSAPAAASTTKASTSGIALPISIPLPGHPGGRSEFLTDAIQTGSLAGLDEEGNAGLDEDLRKITRDVSHKQMAGSKCIHDEDEEAEDGDGSMFEDRSEIRAYHQNYLTEVDQKTFNLKNHSKYLDIILVKPGITQDVVFTIEVGRAYLAKKRKVLTNLYDQGVLTPLPAVPGSKQFSGQGGHGYHLRYGNRGSSQHGQNIANNNPDGFGRMCLDGTLGFTHRKSAAAVLQDMR